MVAVEAVRPGGPKAHLPVSFASDQHISPKGNMGRKADDFARTLHPTFGTLVLNFATYGSAMGQSVPAPPQSLDR
tara:strand:- start:4406 stop:4630 length:225 start_codon:yes stop_codon:yes gene_type:complete